MALCRLHLDAILAAFAHAIGANLGRPLTKGLAIRDVRQNLVAAPPRARLYRRPGARHGPHPRRGRAARPLPADPAALGPRRDPRLDPGAQRPGGPRPAERPLEDADAPRRRQRAGPGRRGAAPPALSLAALQSLQVGQVSRSRASRSRRSSSPSRSPAAAPRCSRSAGSAPIRTTRSSSSPARPTGGWSRISIGRCEPPRCKPRSRRQPHRAAAVPAAADSPDT